jgi:hypothetical protein
MTAAERAARERAAAGLPPIVQDPATLRAVARLIGSPHKPTAPIPLRRAERCDPREARIASGARALGERQAGRANV